MPELPEVEIVRQSLNQKVKDKIIQKVLVKNRNLRFKIHSKFKNHLNKKKIKKVERFSKYLILTFENKAGFKSTKAVIDADEKDLLAVSGVGINLVKKLKKLK